MYYYLQNQRATNNDRYKQKIPLQVAKGFNL